MPWWNSRFLRLERTLDLAVVFGLRCRRLSAMSSSWHSLCVGAGELRCDVTLCNGQSFAWTSSPSGREWHAVLHDTLVTVRQTDTDTEYCTRTRTDDAAFRFLIRDYFRLDRGDTLDSLYAQWNADERFNVVSASLRGVRLLRQPPLETFVCFLLSSNNNIKRIAAMAAALRRLYGTRVGDIDGAEFHAFPTLKQLATATEAHLRSIGFGYRAPFLVRAVQQLEERGGEDFLRQLRGKERSAVEKELTSFHGVGSKVAACIALFALDSVDAVPVDTHVLQIAQRHYVQHAPTIANIKSLTPRAHILIGDMFRQRFGAYAGWAHTVLFAAELAVFKERIRADAITSAASKSERQTVKVESAVIITGGVHSRKRRRVSSESQVGAVGVVNA